MQPMPNFTFLLFLEVTMSCFPPPWKGAEVGHAENDSQDAIYLASEVCDRMKVRFFTGGEPIVQVLRLKKLGALFFKKKPTLQRSNAWVKEGKEREWLDHFFLQNLIGLNFCSV